mmetsp:Transcript_30111/g.44625  ORF Transcript_30111/g.44625 Transcript_30111/m.44625 type:complete len:135 (-) Transcript_30111:190-594(-)|eukprot:CAMPEP_0195521992 /NCGR_PEP_ID=MMETSP0794_2-20130614/19849_1 /TAXON_ID=515487 /ORGANISM="Stephanopyxis turris, Strain CCMP 815" /LENGTH=134 /DNA_ID=CAMNT_0040651661 /DNA_START=17 /DNA_END=421 /DNA_ORIENTATION=+
MAQLIQRVASWLAQEVAVPLLAKSKPFQAAARASVQGVEKVKDISNTAAEAAAEAAAKSKEAVAQAKRQATAAAVDGEVVEEGPGLFKSISEAIKKDLKRHGKTEEQLAQEAIEENQRISMEFYLKEQQKLNNP